ncbi:NADH dehydrogenase [ubiquinone] 1 beta subcomplex subunit 2, mitochondrial [Agrilus planipennis]|uniref:NADH dehydrogenase [ubiquinone] 1 beta subcomplex subunit 2, mitochondrial n=1 Tax=Agrilus planipennis TaxID=224129 RepID=A0A1W4XIF7_AGRPL|nr:NADH dehydrogenase [ubiquinone] 1 beta subcomplex subunit 2, mitochondrial [Agrilus planipennis]
MIVSRCFSSLKAIKYIKPAAKFSTSSIRNGHGEWHYRGGVVKNPKWVTPAAEIIQGIAWWWVLWHLFTQFDHITGEFEYPDPSKWTDEELGIPEEV